MSDDSRDTIPSPPPTDDVVAPMSSTYAWMHCCDNPECLNEIDIIIEAKSCACRCELCMLAEIARMGMSQVNTAKERWARIVMDRRNK